jgi:hypothetical protein
VEYFLLFIANVAALAAVSSSWLTFQRNRMHVNQKSWITLKSTIERTTFFASSISLSVYFVGLMSRRIDPKGVNIALLLQVIALIATLCWVCVAIVITQRRTDVAK